MFGSVMETLPENRITPTDLPTELFLSVNIADRNNSVSTSVGITRRKNSIGDVAGIYRQNCSVGIYRRHRRRREILAGRISLLAELKRMLHLRVFPVKNCLMLFHSMVTLCLVSNQVSRSFLVLV